MNRELRELSEADLHQVSRVFHSCWHHQYVHVLPSEVISAMGIDEAEKLWNKSYIDRGCSQFFGVFDPKSDELKAFCKCGPSPEDPSEGFLHSLYVDPKYARQGLGKVLLTHVIEVLDWAPGISLWVFGKNEAAQGLYRNAGFHPTQNSRIDDRWQSLEIQMIRVNEGFVKK